MGPWKDDKKHGKGIMVWGSGTKYAGNKYIGDYIDDIRTGEGIYIYANGDRYELRYSYITW